MDPYRNAPAPDLYALYLRSYLATLRDDANARPPATDSVPEMHAIAIGTEDAIAFRLAWARDGSHEGYRERWNLLDTIEKYDTAERPDDE